MQRPFVILMAYAFCGPEDLCNPGLHARCRQSCIGPPAPKNGAIRMTRFLSQLHVHTSLTSALLERQTEHVMCEPKTLTTQYAEHTYMITREPES